MILSYTRVYSIVYTDGPRHTLIQRYLLQTQAAAATGSILMVSVLFISKRLSTFFFPSVRGAGPFADIGFPHQCQGEISPIWSESAEVVCVLVEATFLALTERAALDQLKMSRLNSPRTATANCDLVSSDGG